MSELIARLADFPEDAAVLLHWDGASRTSADAAWLTQAGHVSIGDLSQPVYADRDRAPGAIASKDNRYLSVSEMLGIPIPPDEDDW